MVNGIQVTPTPTFIDLDTGGAASGNFVADTDYSAGQTTYTTAPITTSQVTNPAPQAVYQTVRFGTSFFYTIPNLTRLASFNVRLDFAEIFYNSAGKRIFNVVINGVNELTNFDVWFAAGGENVAIAETFTVAANASGQIVIQFTADTDNAIVNGIEITNTSGIGPLAIVSGPGEAPVNPPGRSPKSGVVAKGPPPPTGGTGIEALITRYLSGTLASPGIDQTGPASIARTPAYPAGAPLWSGEADAAAIGALDELIANMPIPGSVIQGVASEQLEGKRIKSAIGL